jgi:hypothetical protein
LCHDVPVLLLLRCKLCLGLLCGEVLSSVLFFGLLFRLALLSDPTPLPLLLLLLPFDHFLFYLRLILTPCFFFMLDPNILKCLKSRKARLEWNCTPSVIHSRRLRSSCSS